MKSYDHTPVKDTYCSCAATATFIFSSLHGSQPSSSLPNTLSLSPYLFSDSFTKVCCQWVFSFHQNHWLHCFLSSKLRRIFRRYWRILQMPQQESITRLKIGALLPFSSIHRDISIHYYNEFSFSIEHGIFTV